MRYRAIVLPSENCLSELLTRDVYSLTLVVIPQQKETEEKIHTPG
jgi:hypothetical protein